MLDIAIQYQRGNFNLNFQKVITSPIVGLFGASGVGKSTLLALIAGLIKPNEGHIFLDGLCLFDSHTHVNLPPHQRHIATVFQDGRLFPHLSVKNNLLYGYKLVPETHRQLHLDEVVELLALKTLLSNQPYQLSGGESQRVALGRALLMSPKFLLLDEPLASLDNHLKQQILPFLKRIKDEIHIPMIYVSHDMAEIQYLTDEIIRL